MPTYTLQKAGSHIDKVQDVYGSVLSAAVNVSGESKNLSPNFSLTANKWYNVRIFAVVQGTLNDFSGGTPVLTATNTNITNSEFGILAHGLNNSVGGAGVVNLGYRQTAISSGFIPLPSVANDTDETYRIEICGAFRAGASPAIQFGYTSSSPSTDEALWEQFSVQITQAMQTFTP